MTKFRSIWHLLLTTHIYQQDIPIPGLNRQPLDSLSAAELERLTLRALRLRQNWTSLSPVASKEFTLKCDVLPNRLGVIDIQFLPRKSRYLLSLALTSDMGRSFSLQCWDLEATPPICIAMKTLQHFGLFVINAKEYEAADAPVVTQSADGIELLAIDFSGANPLLGFSTVARVRGKTGTLQGLYGSSVLTTGEQNRLNFWDARHPAAQLQLQSSSLQSEAPIEVIVQDGFAVMVRPSCLEIYGIPPLPTSDTTIIVSPVARHSWRKLDSVSVALQAKRTGARPPAINILIRFGSGLPWPANLIHHFMLYPNETFDAARPVDETNVPYDTVPKLRRTIGSPIRLFTVYHMAMGSRGTALWFDTHTEDYFGRSDRGQRLAASLMATTEKEEEVGDKDCVVSTVDASVFSICEDDIWTRVAVDEDEGRVAVGCVDGTLKILEYA